MQPSESAPAAPVDPRPARWRVPRSFLFCVSVVALLVVLFSLLRVGFVLRNLEEAKGATAGQLARAFLIGTRFDLLIACYMVLPAAILGHVPNIGWEQSRRHRRLFLYAFTAVVAFATFLLLAEYEYFREFQSRYNALALQYLDQSKTVFGMVWHDYPVFRYVLACAALTATFAAALRLVMRRTLGDPAPETARRPRTHLIADAVCTALLFGLIVVGMRGGLQKQAIRWGHAYRSDNEFANQLGLNGIYTLGNAVKDHFGDHAGSRAWVGHMSTEKARSVTRGMLLEHDETLQDAGGRTVLSKDGAVNNWLTLRPSARPPNVVLVLMESFSARFVGAVGSTNPRTPEFDKLAADGVLFSRAFSGGTHTHQGIFCSTLGFPNLPGYESLMQDIVSNQPLSSLPTLFKQAGYRTLYLYNGNLSWDNQEGFFRKNGVEKFVGGNDFGPNIPRDKVWGVADKDLLDRANQEFETANAKGPFFAVVLTLSNHSPYDVPKPLPFEPTADMGPLNKRINALRYADWSIGHFMREARKLDYHDNTLFVFVGDHGFHVSPKLSEVHLLYHHVPLLFYAPKLMDRKGIVTDKLAGQVSIAPTILGLLNMRPPKAFWGRNLFSNDFADDNFVVFKQSSGGKAVGMVRGDKLLVVGGDGKTTLSRYDLGFPPSLTPIEGPESAALKDTMRTELLAYVQSAITDLTARKAGLAEAPTGELLHDVK